MEFVRVWKAFKTEQISGTKAWKHERVRCEGSPGSLISVNSKTQGLKVRLVFLAVLSLSGCVWQKTLNLWMLLLFLYFKETKWSAAMKRNSHVTKFKLSNITWPTSYRPLCTPTAPGLTTALIAHTVDSCSQFLVFIKCCHFILCCVWSLTLLLMGTLF